MAEDSVLGGRHLAKGRPAPIRVATLLSHPLGPGSGLGTFILGLTEALQRNPGLDLVLIAPGDVRGAAGRRVSQTLLAFQQLWQLRHERPDVVHTHDHPALLAAAIAYRALSGGRAHIVHSSHLDPVGRRSWWKRILLGWLLARCSVVTVVARNSVEKLALVASPVPGLDIVEVVPGAATIRLRDKSDPAVAAFAASIGHRSGPVLLQVSNFLYPAKVKGTLRLMEAFVEVRQRCPGVRLLLIGTGPLLGTVKEARERLGLTDSVTIPGTFIEDLSLPVGLSDVHCHISLQDACPISILEAMHAGKPVVASRTGGIPELIDDGVTGTLVDDEPSQIAAAIVDFLEHPDKARATGARAQRVAQSRFTWERVATDFERLYGAMPQTVAARAGGEIANLVD
ncbi:MAG: glycosyltransferase [Luteitalea sp.]|nr:glycosyltransferase [Luteitalea sp.]